MQVVVDYREQKLQSLINGRFNFTISNLIIGDIHISKDDIHHIIERKTLNDFSSSIVDGRYAEQKLRLLESNAIIIYIIEGHHKSNNGVPLSTLYSAMYTLQSRDSIVVLRSFSIEETVDIIYTLCKKIESGISQSTSQLPLKIKKKTESVDIYAQMLCCIPGISNTIAQNIIDKFPTISHLLAHINDANTLVCVSKVGPKLSTKIINVLKCNDDNV